MSLHIYEKYCNGDRITDSDLLLAIRDYKVAQPFPCQSKKFRGNILILPVDICGRMAYYTYMAAQL